MIKTFPVLNRGYKLSFQIRPIQIVYGYSSIIHATIGGNVARRGDRTPAIFFNPKSFRLHICSTVGTNKNFCYNSPSLHRYKYANIVVQQVQKASFGNLFYFQIIINGRKVVDALNIYPVRYRNVKYYAGDPWHAPAVASLRQFRIVNLPFKGRKITSLFF